MRNGRPPSSSSSRPSPHRPTGSPACSTRRISRRSRWLPSIQPAVPTRPQGRKARTTTRATRTARVAAGTRRLATSRVRRASPAPGGSDLLLVLHAFQRQHQPILQVVKRVHRLRDRDVLGRPVAQRVFHLGGEALDAKGQVGRKLRLLGDVQHLELIQQLVDVANPVSAGVLKVSLRVPPFAKRRDLDRGLLDHAPASEDPSHASRRLTLLSKIELVKNSKLSSHLSLNSDKASR